MKQSTYLCDIVHVKRKGLPIFSVLTRFLIQGRVNAKFKFKYTSLKSKSSLVLFACNAMI